MKDQRMCDVVQDLLPTYIDGLASEGSEDVIREHLAECEKCRKAYARMTEPEKNETSAMTQAEAPEIDYLRGTKKRTYRLILAVVLAAAVVLASVVLLIFGRRLTLTEDAFVARASVEDTGDGEMVRIEGTVMTGYRFRGLSFREPGDGVLEVRVEASRAFISGKDRSFVVEYTPSEPVRHIWIGDSLAWEDGEQIPVFISDLYKARTQYVGDNSAVGGLITALGVRSSLGSCTMSLQTAEEPYGMTVHLAETLDSGREEAAVARMRSYACALLALIDNLGEASFEYALDRAPDEPRLITVTESEATLAAGADIKQAAATAAGLTRLMTDLGLVDNYVSAAYTYEGREGIRLDVILSTDGTFDAAELAVLSGNEVISNMGTIHADETPWTPGETIDFEVMRENFGKAGGISDGETFTVQLSLDVDGKTSRTEPLDLTYRDGAVYETVLTGSPENGFVLSAR